MMMLDYKGRGGFKNIGKSDYVICERSLTSRHNLIIQNFATS